MSIQELIDKKLAENQKKERVRSGKFSPSSFGQCFRRQIWSRQNKTITDPPDARTLRIFSAGNLFHDFVQGIIIKEHPNANKEVLVETDDIKGFADLVDGENVWDIKSQHSMSFHHLRKANDIGVERFANVLQVLWYTKELRRKLGHLVFISKDDLCIAEYAFSLTPEWETALSTELDSLRYFWREKITPPAVPRLYPQKDGSYKECQYCQFRTTCKGGVNEV